MKSKLSNGLEIPNLGYGVYRIPTKGVTKDCVLKALKAGYRHIDTAQAYQNEEEVGQAIKESGIKREEIFVTTKIWISNFGEQKTYDSFMESLKKLDMPYVDLILLHQCYNDVYGSWRALERIYKEGKAKSIGVSNFWPNRLVDLCLHCEIKPMINQIEVNPFDQKVEWRKWDDKYGVITEAWGPLGEGRNNIFENPTLTKIAKAHNTWIANVIFRYLLDLNIVILCTTTKEERMKTNQEVDFKLTEEEKKEIEALDMKKSLFFDHTTPETVEMMKGFEK
jgi:2,5-diketo-D-gluconate reductase A